MIFSGQFPSYDFSDSPFSGTFATFNYNYSGQISLLKNAIDSCNGSEIENIVPNLNRYILNSRVDPSIIIETDLIKYIIIAIKNCDIYAGMTNRNLAKKNLFLFLASLIDSSIQVAENAAQFSLFDEMLFYMQDQQCSVYAMQIVEKLFNYKDKCVDDTTTRNFISGLARNILELSESPCYIENQEIINSNLSVLSKILQETTDVDNFLAESVIRIFTDILLKYSNSIKPSIVVTISECAKNLAKKDESWAMLCIKSSVAQLLSNFLKNYLLKESWESILIMFATLTQMLENGSEEFQILLNMINFNHVISIFVDRTCGSAALELMNNIIASVPGYVQKFDGVQFFEAIKDFISCSGIKSQKSAFKISFALIYKGNDEFSHLFFDSPLSQEITQSLCCAGNFLVEYGITAIRDVLHRWQNSGENLSALIEFLQFYFTEFLNDVINDDEGNFSEDIIDLAQNFMEEIKDL